MQQVLTEGKAGVVRGNDSDTVRKQPSRTYRLADNAEGYRKAAATYGELANNARCIAQAQTGSLADHFWRVHRHWKHWQARCLKAANLHDQRSEG
jgi:hypothetical protein